MELKVICKRLIVQNLDGDITEGEYGADVIRITVPRMYGIHDLGTFSFRMTAISADGSNVAEQILLMESADDENVFLLWTISSDFTLANGEVSLILAGVNPDNTVQIKFLSPPVNINDDKRIEFLDPSLSMLEQTYNQVQLEAQKAVDAANRAEIAVNTPAQVSPATPTVLGGILSGGDLSVDKDGTATVNSVGGKTLEKSVPADAVFTDTVYTLPKAAEGVLGGVIPDGKTVSVDGRGVISCIGRGGSGTSLPDTVTAEFSGHAAITDSTACPVLQTKIMGKTELDSENMMLICPGDLGTLEIRTCRKNLFPWSDYTTAPFRTSSVTSHTVSADEISVMPNADKSNSGLKIFESALCTYLPFCDGKRIILSCEIRADAETTISFGLSYPGRELFTVGTSWQRCFVAYDFSLITEESKNLEIYSVYSGVNFKARNFQIEIVESNIAEPTAYEPYAGKIASITSGLPLCQVGDVHDELIFNLDGTGKIIKRTGYIDLYAGETITTEYISSSGSLNADDMVVYLLEMPAEVALSADELASLKLLETFDGTTYIMNDGSAEQSVEYCTNPLVGKVLYPILKRASA